MYICFYTLSKRRCEREKIKGISIKIREFFLGCFQKSNNILKVINSSEIDEWFKVLL